MICSKCGEQCSDNQAFCLKCGNTLQFMDDFSLIEKELASNIDEFMNEMEGEELEPYEDDEEEMKTIDVPLEEINMELKVMDINRNTSRNINRAVDYDDEDITPVHIPERKPDKSKKSKGKKSNKKLYMIIGGAVVAVAAIVLVLVFAFSGDDSTKDNIEKNFAYYYGNAESAYSESQYDTALDEVLKAVDLAQSDEDKLKARTLLKEVYESQNYTGEYYISNLEELFNLGDNSKELCEALLNSYKDNKNTDGMIKLYSVLTEDEVKTILGDAYVEKPQADMEAGQYNNHLTVNLSAAEGSKIYYGIVENSDQSAAQWKEYSGKIEILQTGKYTVKAYAVNDNGIASYITELDYTIVEGAEEGPVVSPAAGTYKEPVQITVQIPEGGKVYYTYDGTTPTESSTEYKEPVDMLRDVSTFKAIAVDQYGNVSEVTSVQYNLKIPRNETIASGKEKVWNDYYNNGKIDVNGNQADGSVLSISYSDAVVIENNEYYIYEVVATTVDGQTTTGITYCAVNTYDGNVIVGLIKEGDDIILP